MVVTRSTKNKEKGASKKVKTSTIHFCVRGPRTITRFNGGGVSGPSPPVGIIPAGSKYYAVRWDALDVVQSVNTCRQNRKSLGSPGA